MSDSLRAIIPLVLGGFVVWKLFMKRAGNGDAPNLKVDLLYVRQPDRGESVYAIQHALTYLGYPVGQIDGIFGPNTEEAVRKFQRENGLQNDGVVGPETMAALDEQLRRDGGSFLYTGA